MRQLRNWQIVWECVNVYVHMVGWISVKVNCKNGFMRTNVFMNGYFYKRANAIQFSYSVFTGVFMPQRSTLNMNCNPLLNLVQVLGNFQIMVGWMDLIWLSGKRCNSTLIAVPSYIEKNHRSRYWNNNIWQQYLKILIC